MMMMMMLLENQWAQGLNRWKYPMMDIHSPNHWARIKPLSTHNTRHYMMSIIITRRMMTIWNLKDIIIELGNSITTTIWWWCRIYIEDADIKTYGLIPWWCRWWCSVVIPWRRNDDGGQIASCHAQQNCVCCGLHTRPDGENNCEFPLCEKILKTLMDRKCECWVDSVKVMYCRQTCLTPWWWGCWRWGWGWRRRAWASHRWGRRGRGGRAWTRRSSDSRCRCNWEGRNETSDETKFEWHRWGC